MSHVQQVQKCNCLSTSKDVPFLFPVKIWVSNMAYSAGIVNAEANVCSVRFHPASRYYLAYGCAGNKMY